MTANPNAPLAPVNMLPMIQAYLNQSLVLMKIAKTDFRNKLRSGQKIDFPYVPDLYVQDYDQGTDMTFPAQVGVADQMTINQSRAANFTLGKNELVQAEDKGYQAKLAKQAAFRISNDIDQKGIKEGVDNANNSVTGGTLNATNIYSTLTDAMASLHRSNAGGRKFVIMDPERVALLAQNEVANGWKVADSALKNGFVGDSQAGFKVFMSNNLPTQVVLTMDTQPTNGDTFTIFGVTFTWVTDGTAANAGEVNIGANLADAQAIFVTAVNGTTPPNTDDYIDVSTENRRKLQNAGVTAGTFSANTSTITAYGKINASETFTAGTNVFGTETGSLLAGDYGAICIGMQRMPEMDWAKLPNRPQETNYSFSALWGKKVFHRDQDRLVDITINV